MKRAALHSLGCKVNSYETEAMQEMLSEQGYEIVAFEEPADVYVINTCSVTSMADRKSRQMLHRARKQNPEALVIAAGCYVQSAEEALLQDPAVDILIGNNEKAKLPGILKAWEETGKASHVHDMSHEKQYEEMSRRQTAGHTRAYVKIQDGCDQFCTYCIIPYTRGRVRSRSLPDILSEVETLAGNGYQEVVLTGIHLDSYGADLPDKDLLDVIRAAAGVEGIRRIRLGSLEPRIMTEPFVRGLASVEKLCPHFHLSLQSGCDETLKRMNRRYDTQEFRACCERLRAAFDQPALTTDVMVGFPGETEEEFARTVAFLEEIRFYEMHVFKYSRRKGTRADRMEGQIPEPVKTQRSEALLKLTKEQSRAYRQRLLGATAEVLMEEPYVCRGEVWQTGHTETYVKVAVPGEMPLMNRLLQVKVDGFLENDILRGILTEADRK
ncbi:MAG: tRNA (N(6)-L-threonylcarbamoyladenosine(37)-C(2))-methylthiotransferase MtaB [Lachnospiraceae bacterium]|nr:tRNA (N(6)-L-threonylcarbamoyladenosine(37)-C(2))-methylthiotransferase MtaB [Lachnospiraceae bacterium]